MENKVSEKKNGLAIAGFVCSLCGFVTCGLTSFVGLILSIVGLVKSKDYNENGKGLSIAGIIIGAIFILIYILIFGLGIIGTEDTSNSSKQEHSEKQEMPTTKADSNITTTKKSKEIVKQEFISSCQSIAYEDIARNPDNYIGTKAVFTGEVIQIQEGLFDSIVMRVNVTKGEYDIWDDTIYVNYTYSDGESKFLEDDIITMYGTLEGSKTYTTVLGSTVTIPQFNAKYIKLN